LRRKNKKIKNKNKKIKEKKFINVFILIYIILELSFTRKILLVIFGVFSALTTSGIIFGYIYIYIIKIYIYN